jgi:hypothetical protein
LDVDQISVINFEYRLAFCALPAHLEQVHAIFVSKKMLEGDPKFEKSLLEKAQKQQDLVVMSYDSKGTTKVLYECSILCALSFSEESDEGSNGELLFNGSIT